MAVEKTAVDIAKELKKEITQLKAEMYDLAREGAAAQSSVKRYQDALQSLATLVVAAYKPEIDGRSPKDLDELVKILSDKIDSEE